MELWVRIDVDGPRAPRIRRGPDYTWQAWCACIRIAKRKGDRRGLVPEDHANGEELAYEEGLPRLGAEFQAALDYLISTGLLEADDDGLLVAGWDKRQRVANDKTATERKRRQRAAQRAPKDRTATERKRRQRKREAEAAAESRLKIRDTRDDRDASTTGRDITSAPHVTVTPGGNPSDCSALREVGAPECHAVTPVTSVTSRENADVTGTGQDRTIHNPPSPPGGTWAGSNDPPEQPHLREHGANGEHSDPVERVIQAWEAGRLELVPSLKGKEPTRWSGRIRSKLAAAMAEIGGSPAESADRFIHAIRFLTHTAAKLREKHGNEDSRFEQARSRLIMARSWRSEGWGNAIAEAECWKAPPARKRHSKCLVMFKNGERWVADKAARKLLYRQTDPIHPEEPAEPVHERWWEHAA